MNHVGSFYLVHILAYMNIVKHINLDIEMFTFDFSYGIFHDRIAIYFTAWICIIATRGDHGDPLVQNSLGAPVHSDLWGNIRHFCKRDIF